MGELADYLAQHDENFRKARLPALYSDFRPQRTLNPDGYQANISAWRHALSRLASEGQLSRQGSNSSAFVLNLDNALLRSLENRVFGQPLAFGTAVRETVANRGFIPLQDFLKSPQSIYQHSWSELPWNAMTWTLRQLGVIDIGRGEDKVPAGKFVVIENVEAAGRELGERMADKVSRFDRIFTKAQFQRQFADNLAKNQRLSEADIDVLLRFLARDKGTIVYDGKTIRVKGMGDQGEITEEDTTIASIKELMANLNRDTDLLNMRIEELEQTAKNAVARKNRVAALAALKSKKLAENTLGTRYATLSQLEEIASKIEQASDQIQLVQVLDSSTGVLKTLNAKVGGIDRVDRVMEGLRERMSDTEEVAAILAESSAPVDEGEVDAELAAMEGQETEKEEEAQRKEAEAQQAKEAELARKKLDELPQVPSAAEPEEEKEMTPTKETGIADLAI